MDQLRLAAYSVSANIVEGQSRHTTKEYVQFLSHTRGSIEDSIEEVRYLPLFSKDLGYLNGDVYLRLQEEYEMVAGFLVLLSSP